MDPIILNAPNPNLIVLKAPPKEAGKVLKFIGSPRLTAVLGGVLGTLIGGPLVGAKAFAGAGLGAGLLKSSLVRKTIVEKVLQPEKIGQGLADIIDNPKTLLPDRSDKKGIVEKAKDVTKKAGVVAGLGALAVGGAVAGKKALDKVKDIKVPKFFGNGTPEAVLPSPSPISPIAEPFGAVQPEVPIEDKIKDVAPVSMPSIKITNKPSINIKFSKRRKFINQQVLVRK